MWCGESVTHVYARCREGERIFHTSLPQSKVDAKSPANKMTAVSKIKL